MLPTRCGVAYAACAASAAIAGSACTTSEFDASMLDGPRPLASYLAICES
ncbi:hypothetical protein [Clostridium sp. L2-50]|nr:hypothetical protein [Clostridium sp. L2-50]UEA73564.1 hypothetical protein LK416_07560 [Lachnospiraceae bacterium GAM79]